MKAYTKKQRAQEVVKRLKKKFPDAHCELNFLNVFELFVAVQLSAQCTDKRVNTVTPALFQRIKNWEDLATIPNEELEKYIFSTGFYRNKAKNLINAAKMVIERYEGELPRSITDMVRLPGVARKTANVVLETGFGIVEGIVVDTHVKRISRILELSTEILPEKIEKSLMNVFPKKKWGNVGHLFVWHGRRTCIARRPECQHCCLSDICPKASLFGK
jgi:endonuclease-3